MATAFDVAVYVLAKRGTMSHMKLQKLLYYAQSWSLVWDEMPLFEDRIEAWANGPVVPTVYSHLRGKYRVEASDVESLGNLTVLTSPNKESIDRVLEFYGDHDSQWLSDLTHMEKPWQEARVGISPGERGNREISHASMAEYYSGL